MRYPWIRTKGLVSPNGATRPKPRVRERWRRDGTLGFGTSIFKEPYRVWSPLQGYAPWALGGSPRWGLASPLQHDRSKVSNLVYLASLYYSKASLLSLIRRVLKPSKPPQRATCPGGRLLRDISQQTERRQSALPGIAVSPLRDIPHEARSSEGANFPYSPSKGMHLSRPSSILSRNTS